MSASTVQMQVQVQMQQRQQVFELDDQSPMANNPPAGTFGMNVTLKAHQRTLLHRCMLLESGPVPLEQFPTLLPLVGGGGGGGAAASSSSHLRTRIGILGDKPGSGKSYVILSMILADKLKAEATAVGAEAGDEDAQAQAPGPEAAGWAAAMDVPDPTVHAFGHNRVVLSIQERPRTLGVTVVVIPHHLCVQWEGYVRTFGGGLRFVCVSRKKHLEKLRDPRDGTLSIAQGVDLVLVTNSFHNALADVLHGVRLRRVVYDEADSLSISWCSTMDAGFHWFVTASFRNLLLPFGDGFGAVQADNDQYVPRLTGIRSSGFMKALFADLYYTNRNGGSGSGSGGMISLQSRKVAQALVVKNKDSFVDASLMLPSEVVRLVLCRTPHMLNLLAGEVNRAIVQYLNANDLQSALQHVSRANRRSEDTIVAVLMEEMSRSLHNLQLTRSLLPSRSYANEADRAADDARLSAKCDDLARRMDRIRERIKTTNTCCICYETMVCKTVVSCCSNSFCFACISKWRVHKSVCPLCKEPLNIGDLLVVTPEAEVEGESEASTSTSASPDGADGAHNQAASAEHAMAATSAERDKLQNLEAILRARCCGQHATKVMLYSAFDNTFIGIQAMLERLELRYRYLRGNPSTVAFIEREYRDGDLGVLLVNTNNYGSGLNCENTTDVVLMHKLDTDMERQVVGRTQRWGRTQPLNVWYLVHDNEMHSNGINGFQLEMR